MMSDDAHERFSRRALLLHAPVLIGAATGILAFPAAVAGAETSAGQVDAINGRAHAELEARKRELQRAASVYFGDLVSTEDKSLLTLKLGQRTTLKLGARAQMRIDRYMAESGGEFNLISGPMMFERTGAKAKGDINFRNAYGLMAVRGTRFFAGMNRGKFAVLVGAGRVDVTAGGRTVRVGPQQGTDIAAPGAAPGPAKSWSGARIAEMLASFK